MSTIHPRSDNVAKESAINETPKMRGRLLCQWRGIADKKCGPKLFWLWSNLCPFLKVLESEFKRMPWGLIQKTLFWICKPLPILSTIILFSDSDWLDLLPLIKCQRQFQKAFISVVKNYGQFVKCLGILSQRKVLFSCVVFLLQ